MSENSNADQFIQVLAIIFEIDPGDLSRETAFVDDLNANSLRMFMVTNHVKELTGAEVTVGQLKGCDTIGDAIDLVDRLSQDQDASAAS
jgi:acyl carrier protein